MPCRVCIGMLLRVVWEMYSAVNSYAVASQKKRALNVKLELPCKAIREVRAVVVVMLLPALLLKLVMF